MPGKFWNSKENKILKKHYSNVSWKELLRLLPGRTRPAISLHAERDLGLRRINLAKRPYTAKEKAIILEYFPEASREKIMTLLPGRSWIGIRFFARFSLNLNRVHLRPSWSKEELTLLREAVEESRKANPRQDLSKLLECLMQKTGRSKVAIDAKMRALQLSWQRQISIVGVDSDARINEDKKWLKNLRTR